MTPAEAEALSSQVAALNHMLDARGLGRLGGDAAIVVASALQTLTALLDPETPMDYHSLGAARFPGYHPPTLYHTPTPIVDHLEPSRHPNLIQLVDRTPGGTNGPVGMGFMVFPGDQLVDLIETLGGAPMAADPGRPRQCHLRLEHIGPDRCLLLIVRFIPHLLTAWRGDEYTQLTTGGPTVFRSGLRAEVVGMYPTWPRTYRVRTDDRAAVGFARYFTVTAAGDRIDSPTKDETHADQNPAEAQEDPGDQEADAV